MCAEMNCWGTSTKTCVPLGYYSAHSGTSLPTFRDNILFPYSKVKRSKENAEFNYIAVEALNHANIAQSVQYWCCLYVCRNECIKKPCNNRCAVGSSCFCKFRVFLKSCTVWTFGSTENLQNNRFNVPWKLMLS